MINVEILGIGKYLPKKTIHFGKQTRYRVEEGDSQISMAVNAINVALQRASLTIDDIDCIVGACAVGVQPIPCTASLIHEQIAMGKDIPAIDIIPSIPCFSAKFPSSPAFIPSPPITADINFIINIKYTAWKDWVSTTILKFLPIFCLSLIASAEMSCVIISTFCGNSICMKGPLL